MTLTKAQQKLMADLGLTSDDLDKAQARQARETKRSAIDEVFEAHTENLAEFVTAALEVSPISPSSKEGSTWVGSVVTGEVGGLSVKVTITDTAAVEAAKAAQRAAKQA